MSNTRITTLFVVPADVLLELVVVMRTTQTLHVTSESEHKDLTLTSTETYIMFGWAQAITITGGKGTLLGSHFAHLLNSAKTILSNILC